MPLLRILPARASRRIAALGVALGTAGVSSAVAESHGGSFSYSNGVIYVDVIVNGDTPAVCLIDTGANVSAIDTRLAERLDLPVLATSTVLGTAGSIEVQNVRLDSLSIHDSGTSPVGSQPMMTLPWCRLFLRVMSKQMQTT